MTIQTLDAVIRTHRAGRSDRIAMRADDRTRTWQELSDESARVAHGLLEVGVAPQDRVAFLDRNVPEYFPMLFGASMINAVTVAVNWRLAAPEMEYILNHARARVLFIGPDFLGHLEKMKLETVECVVVIGANADDHVAYGDWIANRPMQDPAVGCEEGDVCYQLYTSGTTGLPKGVELTHRNLMTSMYIGGLAWGVDPDSVTMVAMPLFHIGGSGWAIATLLQGGEIVVVYELDPPAALRLLETHKITNSFFVPAVTMVRWYIGAASRPCQKRSRITC
jgi:long-chain acyl-CoA synthetase